MAFSWILLALLAVECRSQVVITMEPEISPWFIKAGSNFSAKCIVRNAPSDANVEVLTLNYDDVSMKGFKVSKSVKMEYNKPVINVFINKDPIDKQDRGNYMCKVGDTEKNFNLLLVEVTTQSSNVTVGEDVTIRCDPNTNFNHMELVWSKNGQRLDTMPGVKERVKLGESNFSLTLQKTVEDDAGEYECDFIFFKNNPISRHSFKDVAKMFGKPYFKNGVVDSSVSISGNQTIDLTCNAYGYPKPVVDWLKDDEVIQSEGRVKITDTENGARLEIVDVESGDAGQYVCNVENSLGRKQRSFVVSIEGIINNASFLSFGFAQLILGVSCLLLTVCGI